MSINLAATSIRKKRERIKAQVRVEIRSRTRRFIVEDFLNGLTAWRISKAYGVHLKTVRNILRDAEGVADIGVPPADKRRPYEFRGYVEVSEPILKAHCVTWAQFFGDTRVHRVTHARWEVWHVLRGMGKSLSSIARFSNKDHTTILHGAREWVKRNPMKEAAE